MCDLLVVDIIYFTCKNTEEFHFLWNNQQEMKSFPVVRWDKNNFTEVFNDFIHPKFRLAAFCGVLNNCSAIIMWPINILKIQNALICGWFAGFTITVLPRSMPNVNQCRSKLWHWSAMIDIERHFRSMPWFRSALSIYRGSLAIRKILNF